MQHVTSATPMTLTELRALVYDGFIGRNASRIAEFEAERRAGRAKVKEHLELEELRRVEEAEWESGFGEYDQESSTRKLGMESAALDSFS